MSAVLETLSPTKSAIPTPLMEKDEQNNEDEEKKTSNGSKYGAEENNSNRTNDNADEQCKEGENLKIRISNKDNESASCKLNETTSRGGNVPIVSEEPDVQMLSLSIISPGRPDIVLADPFASSPKACLFTLKEGTKYRIKFYFNVFKNTVHGLKYISQVYKAGVRVDKSTVLLGTFDAREEPYEYELEEDTTPSGVFVRGTYAAKIKVADEKGTSYFNINYHFDIQRNWAS